MLIFAGASGVPDGEVGCFFRGFRGGCVNTTNSTFIKIHMPRIVRTVLKIFSRALSVTRNKAIPLLVTAPDFPLFQLGLVRRQRSHISAGRLPCRRAQSPPVSYWSVQKCMQKFRHTAVLVEAGYLDPPARQTIARPGSSLADARRHTLCLRPPPLARCTPQPACAVRPAFGCRLWRERDIAFGGLVAERLGVC